MSAAAGRAAQGGVVVVETRRAAGDTWIVTVRDDSTVTGLGAPDTMCISVQTNSNGSNWTTTGTLVLGAGEDRLGLATLRDKRRVVLAGGWEFQLVPAHLFSGGTRCELISATQGSVGNFGSGFLATGGGVSLGVGDSLTLTYRATSSPPDSTDGCLVSARTGAGTFGIGSSRLARDPKLPARFVLHQNQPNPFGAGTSIRFDLPTGGVVRLEVFDSQGRRVETLANQYYPPGYHAIRWNTSSDAGSRFGPGVYFCRIQAGPFRDQRKMVLLKR
jgi:hypothetical protein